MKKVFNVFKKRWYVFLIILLIGGFYLYNRQSVAAKKEQESMRIEVYSGLNGIKIMAGHGH